MLDKRISHSIYLIKPGFVENETFLQNIGDCRHFNVSISGYPNAKVYLKTTPSKSHSWSKLLPTDISGINWAEYRTQTLWGLLLIEVNERLFALTSGFGRHLLHPFSVENRFGLKVVLNSIEPQTIQQLSKKTLSENPKSSIEQVSKGVNINQFGIDGFLDLIQRVRGKSKIENLGLSLDGEDSLKISVDDDLNQLPELLTECLSLFSQDDYKHYFPEINNLAEVKDREQESVLNTDLEVKLNRELKQSLANGALSGDIWASIPEIIPDSDFECFVFKKTENALRYHDIELKYLFHEHYRKADGTKKKEISITSLKRNRVYIRKSDGTSYEKWKAISCINAVIEKGQDRFFFIEGKWYRASLGFIKTLDQKINSIPSSNLVFSDWPQHVKEKDFLESNPLTYDENYTVLDGNNIYLEGQSPIEPCDIYTQDKLLIHVKRYGSSSMLGHLFNQGFVSGSLLVNDIEFKEKLNEKLEEDFRIDNVNPANFTIAYVIGTTHMNDINLPLFSKINLARAYDELKKKGFNVTLDFCNMTLN